MIRLVTIGGSGDVYLVCALFEVFRQHHGREDVVVVGPMKYATIAAMFPVPYLVDNELIRQAEGSIEMQRTYENVLIAEDTTFYVHPCFLRSEIRVDKLTTKHDASQADMYRMILRVPLDAPLAVPTRRPEPIRLPYSVIIIPEAVSWPNDQPAFWPLLANELRAIGRHVQMNDQHWPLEKLFERCAAADWVIGPQCGIMSILCTGQFPCRKTLASARLTEANKKLVFLTNQTFPYAYVTKFSNADYDIEEFEIRDENHFEVASAIATGVNAIRLRPHDPRPVVTVQVPLAPGDFLDRLAIATVKRRRFVGAKRAAVEREYQRLSAIRSYTPMPPEADEHFAQLVAIHDSTFTLLQRMVPEALAGLAGIESHTEAVRANKDRIAVKARIDEACRAPYTEVKSYYGPDDVI